MSEKMDRLAELFKQVSVAKGPGLPHQVIKAYITRDGDLNLVWDKPHASGYTRQYTYAKIEDLPEVAELLLGIYREQQPKEEEE